MLGNSSCENIQRLCVGTSERVWSASPPSGDCDTSRQKYFGPNKEHLPSISSCFLLLFQAFVAIFVEFQEFIFARILRCTEV